MYSQENDFYVCLLSNNSLKYYKENTLSSFTNLLSSPCNLNCGEWKVGITEIAFNTYVKDKSYIRNRRSVDTRFTPKTNLILPKSKVSDVRDHNKVIVVQGETQSTVHGDIIPVMYIPSALSQLPDPIIKKPNANANTNKSMDDSQVGVSLTQSFPKKPKKTEQQPTVGNQSFDIPPPIWNEGSSELGLSWIESHQVLNFMYVYTDIIKPRYVGDIKSRYLKIIPKLNTDADVIKFDHIEYCTVEKGFIENISILIMDSQGEKINFIGGSSPTYTMLHFKRM